MKKIISLLLTVVMVLGSAFTLASCAPKDSGAQISVYLSDVIYDFDPTEYYADDNAAQVMSLLFEPLFRLSENGKLKMAAAEDYDVDEDERTIVIELRESYWSNGSRVTADDFIYAWRDKLLEPANPNPAAALLYDIEGAMEIKQGSDSLYNFGASRTSLYEISIKYREGADVDQLLKNLASIATAPVSQSAIASSPDYWTKSSGTCISNGPFQLYGYDPEGEFSLTRNLGYHQKTTVKNYTKNVTPYTLVSFWSGEHAVELTYEQIEEKTVFYMGNALLSERKEYEKKAEVADTLSTYGYLFNTNNPLFANEKVRYALSVAIDREQIVEAITFGKAATGFLPETVVNSKNRKFSEEILSATAQKALAEQLLSEVDLSGLDKSFTLTIDQDEESAKIAELVKAKWEELGFTVTIQAAEPIVSEVLEPSTGTKSIITDNAIQVLLNDAAQGIYNFDCLALDWQMYSYDPFVALCAFTSTMNGNGVQYSENYNEVTVRGAVGGWANETYDGLVANAMQKSGTDRDDVLNDAEELLVKSAPFVPVIFNQNFAFVSNKLRNVDIDGFGNFVFTKARLRNYENYLPPKDED